MLVDKFTLTGTILIHNICFEKTVKVRYTRDYWLTHQEVVSNYCSPVAGDIDKFSFSLTLPRSLPPGARVELCVCATLGEQEFWDSNFDRNYQIECLLMPPKSRGLHDLINGGIHLMPRVSLEEDSSAGIYYWPIFEWSELIRLWSVLGRVRGRVSPMKQIVRLEYATDNWRKGERKITISGTKAAKRTYWLV